MASSSSTVASDKSMVVERTSQEPALKCPRCDSSNTKFCYYNNYSLSQPRHFCKACKRYWTRGGTLRNVPVGGACRKNNRVKRPPQSTTAGDSISAATSAGNPSFLQSRVDLSHNSLLYEYNNVSTAETVNPLDFRFPFSGPTTVPKFSSDENSFGLFEIHQPCVRDLGIGFSSSSSGLAEDGGGGLIIPDNNIEFRNGFSSNVNGFLGSSSVFDSSTSTAMASLLAYSNNSGGLTNDIEEGNSNNVQDLTMPYHQGKKGSTEQLRSGRSSNPNNPDPTSNGYHVSQTDPSSFLMWNPSSVSSSAWFDPSNKQHCGLFSSFSSLI